MSLSPSQYDAALERAVEHARAWLQRDPDRPIPPALAVDAILAASHRDLSADGVPADEVIDTLAAIVEPGLMDMGSGRFFGWVIGGTLPAALAADWLVSAWDQNAALRFATPGVVAVEEMAGQWLLELLGLPASSDVGFVTGGTTANFVGLASGRQHVLDQAGWDLDRDGLTGAPRITVLVGEDRHASVDLALRYLGLGAPTPVAADSQGRMRPEALADALSRVSGPVIVALQAGNLHSGGFDPFGACIDLAHEADAWVHVDGAFGLWAGVSPALRHLVDGYERADSWGTDAHKTLNAPYDCGIAIVRDATAIRGAMGLHASYLVQSTDRADPFENVPEFSRRARGVPVWAALASLGSSGVAELVDRLVARAQSLAVGIASIPGAEILNDVVYTQICVSFGSDERTREVTARVLADGTAWMSGSRWHDRDVLRVSVSNWSTDEADVAASIDAVRRAAT